MHIQILLFQTEISIFLFLWGLQDHITIIFSKNVKIIDFFVVLKIKEEHSLWKRRVYWKSVH